VVVSRRVFHWPEAAICSDRTGLNTQRAWIAALKRSRVKIRRVATPFCV
jgi:hypothetical protein